jgi:hypothetical protein
MILRFWRWLVGTRPGCVYEIASDGQRVRVEARTPHELFEILDAIGFERIEGEAGTLPTPGFRVT